tara:strand:+ start:15556 stop:15672 length:117 start_codon:yes stop_codon:yes gene_type:complete
VKSIEINKTCDKPENQITKKEAPEQHQALLKNYIGDFF